MFSGCRIGRVEDEDGKGRMAAGSVALTHPFGSESAWEIGFSLTHHPEGILEL